MMKRVLYILILVTLLPGEETLYAEEKAPFFNLTLWGEEERLGLDDFRGQIVVLDFFSASCAICFRASREIGIDIKDYYAERSGNPSGIPVQVVAVNSDLARRDDMLEFIDETEISILLDDSDGAVLERYGGTTLPYLVVIDATGEEPEVEAPRVVYSQSGYKGTDELRKVIDMINGQFEDTESEPAIQYETTRGTARSLKSVDLTQGNIHETALDIASLIASDVLVTDTVVQYQQKRTSMEFTLAISYRRIEVDYASEYLNVRREDHLTTDQIGVQSSAYLDLDEKFKLKFEGGAYDGYQSYRAVWLNEYYRHMFNVLSQYITDLKGYRKADPRGYNVSLGLRWEYLPSAGFTEGSISYQHDVVSPGYEVGFPILRLRDNYDTLSGRLAFENVLTRRIRTLVECRGDNTTDRDVRFTVQGALNYAMAEHWVTRLAIAGSKEDPNFSSKSISAVLERDWHSNWFVSLFGRYYEDTSEIANAVVSDAAPPPIETYQAGMGVRRQGIRSSFKLVAGPCFSRYHRQPGRDVAFDQLYEDRDWFSVQFAFMYQF